MDFMVERPLIFQEYDRAENVVKAAPIQLSREQLGKLFQEFDAFADNFNLKLLNLEINNGKVTLKYHSPKRLSSTQLEALQEEFDLWFVAGNVEDWTFDIIPYKKWLVLGYDLK